MSETARGAMPPKGDSLLFPTRARRPAPPAAGRRGRGSEAEKEGFEPSRQGFSPPNALAGRRLQPLGHFSERATGYRTHLRSLAKSPFGGMAGRRCRGMLIRPAPLGITPSRHSRRPSVVHIGRPRALL